MIEIRSVAIKLNKGDIEIIVKYLIDGELQATIIEKKKEFRPKYKDTLLFVKVQDFFSF